MNKNENNERWTNEQKTSNDTDGAIDRKTKTKKK